MSRFCRLYLKLEYKIILALSYFLPESPLWLIKKGKQFEAEKSMLQLRGPKYVMQEEINELGLVSLTQESGGFFDKLKEIRSRSILYPVAKNSDIYRWISDQNKNRNKLAYFI